MLMIFSICIEFAVFALIACFAACLFFAFCLGYTCLIPYSFLMFLLHRIQVRHADLSSNQKSYLGGADQGKMGVTFGARRQIIGPRGR